MSRTLAIALFLSTSAASIVPYFFQGVTRARDKSELLALHKASLAAHLKRDVKFFSAHQADPATMVGRGKVSTVTRSQTDQRFGAYFGSTTFTRYEDVVEPIVNVSADGTMGWVAAQVAVEGEQASSDGTIEKFRVVWAWISISEKRDGKWLMTANASSQQP